MSKKNRNKFRNREANRQVVSAGSGVSANQSAVATSSPSPARAANNNSGAFAQHAAEYRVINADLIRLIVLNAVMLAAVFALYYANRSSGIVEKAFHSIVK